MIYLLRHGEDDENYVGGWSDVDLTEKGIEQVKQVRKQIEQLKIDKIICSTIKRAKTTASIINQTLNKKVEYTDKLRELDKGDLTGMDVELAASKYSDLFKNRTIETKFPNGESFVDLYNRIKEYLPEILSEDNTLLITHRGVINMIYYILNDIPLDMNKTQFNVTHASLHELDPVKKQIRKIN